MRKTVCIPFCVDLIDTALQQVADPSILIFPSRISAAKAKQRFQDSWQLQDCSFLSMEDFKQNLLLPPGPVVADDKRMLCLWQVMDEADREYFHLNNYFDIVEWGNHFFQFFEELCDELVDAEILQTLNALGTFNLLAWQDSYIQRVVAIRERYQALLGSKGFSDPIFYRSPANLHIPWQNCRLVFVNQYYYSKLEKAIINALEQAGNEIVIISQTVGEELDADALQPPKIDLGALSAEDICTENISVIECENPDQMVLAFLARQSPAIQIPEGTAVLVDGKFEQEHYKTLFNPEHYELSQSQSMVSTSVYRLLHTFQKHLSAQNSTLEQSFLPLRLILDACSQNEFIHYYQPEWTGIEKTALLAEIKLLLDQDILYVDTDTNVLSYFAKKSKFPQLSQILAAHFALLAKLSRISSPRELVDFIDSAGGLSIRQLCSENELLYSNILDQFYERLANYASLDRMEIVSSWNGLFASEGIALAAGVLQLFLESLASARIRYNTPKPVQPSFEVSNLLDLRNLSYDTVVFFHAIEGEIPTNPGSVWLLNETQRGNLGLKSYPDLRDRERYYFLRMILSSSHSYLYTYRNQDQDIEPGSFVTELLHASKQGKLAGKTVHFECLAPKISRLYQSRLLAYKPECGVIPGLDDSDICWRGKSTPQSFFVIPCTPEQDFGAQHQVKASYYSLSWLKKNPLAWYLEHLHKLQKTDLRPRETITRKMFGAILHGYLSQILQSLVGRHPNLDKLQGTFLNPSKLRGILNVLLAKSIYLYKIPQNYNHAFLLSIISDCLVESIKQFYLDFLLPNLQNSPFELLPEEEELKDDEKKHKELVSLDHKGIRYSIRIRGKADLRIECPHENFIVDFKTGAYDSDQLIFYEWFYYLLENDFSGKALRSTFWMILKQVPGGRPITDAMREKWKEEIRQALADCLDSGFTLGKAAKDRIELAGVTRADLFRISFGGEA